MRHEFVCPEFARRGKCELSNCIYCKQMKQQKLIASKSKSQPRLKTKLSICKVSAAKSGKTEETPSSSRYFKCESDKYGPLPNDRQEDHLEEETLDEETASGSSGQRQRIKLGTLPAFIPLGESED